MTIRRWLAKNYIGRGEVVKILPNGYLFLANVLTGRDVKTSQNRTYCKGGAPDEIWTTIVDQELFGDTPTHNFIYCGMRTVEVQVSSDGWRKYFVISNGAHTNTIANGLKLGKTLRQIINDKNDPLCRYEVDSHNTPRVAAVCPLNTEVDVDCIRFVIMRRREGSDDCERAIYPNHLFPGGGLFICTYQPNGNGGIETFRGDPMDWPTKENSGEAVLAGIWDALDPSIRVAVVANTIDPETGKSSFLLIDRHTNVITPLV